jgi:hypothetical protein
MRQHRQAVAARAAAWLSLLILCMVQHSSAADNPGPRSRPAAQAPPAAETGQVQFGRAETTGRRSPAEDPAPVSRPAASEAELTSQVEQPASTPPSQPAKPSAVVLDNRDATSVLGKAVRSAANEDMGRVIDVIVDRAGTIRAAVIDFGGFLGVGNRRIAVDWSALHFVRSDRITLEMTRDQVKAAPEYQEGKPIVVLGALGNLAQSRLTATMPER